VDAKLFAVPIEQADRPASGADAANDNKNLLVALGLKIEVELPAAIADKRPARPIVGCLGLDGGEFPIRQPDELLPDFVERQAVAGCDDSAGVVGDPDRNAERAEAGTETAARLVIPFARFGTTGDCQQNMALAARPGIVGPLEHGVDDFES